MPKIAFTVPGVPRGKGRPRTAIRGKFAQLYTDSKTVAYENRILVFFWQAAPGHQPIPKGVPIIVSMEALFPIPASYSKKRKQEAYEYLGKPDSDNMIKCLDALNSVAWVDDSQIWKVDLEKRYTNAEPGLTITIEWATPPVWGLPAHCSEQRHAPTSTLNIALTIQKPHRHKEAWNYEETDHNHPQDRQFDHGPDATGRPQAPPA